MWKNFWDGLNIRKALALIVVGSTIALVFMVRTENLVTAMLTTTSAVVGYYFGYANGQKMGHEDHKV